MMKTTAKNLTEKQQKNVKYGKRKKRRGLVVRTSDFI